MSKLFRMLSLFVLAMCLSNAPAYAEAVCKGQNVLEKLKQEKPEIYAEIERRAKKTINGNALLWRVEKTGAGDASFLFGTLHLPDPRVAALSDKIRTAISEVSTVALELTGTDDHAAIQKELFANPALIMMQGGKTLWDVLDQSNHGQVEKALKNLGMGRDQVANFQPWLPSMMLALSPCFTRRTVTGNAGVDQAVERLARKQGKTLVALETAAEQFGALSGLSIETQAVMLTDSAKLFDRIEDTNETLIQLYLQRRLDWILPFGQLALGNKRTARETAADKEFLESIMSERNRTMAERAEPHLQRGGLMIAVGALHLPGEDGLVNLLRLRGYKVTAVE